MNCIDRLRLVITGCPCSGTHWTAMSLREVYGLDVEHEAFDYKREEKRWWSPKDRSPQIDVSHANAQWLDVPPMSELPVIHLVRHPVKVFNSYFAAMMDHDRNPGLSRICFILDEFNRNACSKASGRYLIHRVEDPFHNLYDAITSLVAVQDLTVLCSSRNEPGPPTNHHNLKRYRWSKEEIVQMPGGWHFLSFYRPFYDL